MNSTQELIDKVRKGLEDRNEVIKLLYSDVMLKRMVIGTLSKRGCTKVKAEDIFVDSIVNFIKACYKHDFKIESSLFNYITGIAKYIWLKEVTNHVHTDTISEDMGDVIETTEQMELYIQSPSKRELLDSLINKLDETCKKLILLWSISKPMKDIAKQMNYKSDGMARKKKHQCLQRLYKIVDEHPQTVKQLRELI
jgi:DNA-directed RNA polymerase specialized sigma24 family protein